MRLIPKAGYVIGGIAGLAATAALFLFLIIRKPYLEVTEVRASSVPLLVEVTWFLSCEEDYFEGPGICDTSRSFPPEESIRTFIRSCTQGHGLSSWVIPTRSIAGTDSLVMSKRSDQSAST